MKTSKVFLSALAVVIAFACVALVSCKKEEEKPDFSDYDSLGYEINDSITVHFGNKRWTTLDYDAHVEHDDISGFDWIYVDAKNPDGGNFPFVRMKFFRGTGTHSGTMTINDIGLGYTIPGALYGDPQCGHVFYFEHARVNSPDGTVTSDWWPMEVTMEVLKFDKETNRATAYIHGTLFDYESWVNREILNVEDCEVREFTITFGDLNVGGK